MYLCFFEILSSVSSDILRWHNSRWKKPYMELLSALLDEVWCYHCILMILMLYLFIYILETSKICAHIFFTSRFSLRVPYWKLLPYIYIINDLTTQNVLDTNSRFPWLCKGRWPRAHLSQTQLNLYTWKCCSLFAYLCTHVFCSVLTHGVSS